MLGVPLSTRAAEPRVTVGLTRTMASAPIYIAAAKRYFAAEGLDVELKFLPTEDSVRRAVASGAVTFAAVNLNAELFRTAVEHHLAAFAGLTMDQAGYAGNTFVIARPAYDAGLRSWNDLSGHRIGVDAVTSGTRYAFAQIARKYALDEAAVRLIPLGDTAAQVRALERRDVDAAFVSSAAALELHRKGRVVVLKRIGDEVPWQDRVIVSRTTTLANRRDMVEAFVRAYQRATAEYAASFLQRDDGGDILADEHSAEDVQIIASYARVATTTVPPLLPWCDKLGRLYESDVRNQVRFWQAQKMLDESAAEAPLDRSFIVDHLGADP